MCYSLVDKSSYFIYNRIMYNLKKGEHMEKEKKGIKVSGVILLIISAILVIYAITALTRSEGKMTLVNSAFSCEYNELMEGWYVEISGIIKNESSYDYKYVQVEFSLYDVNGNNLGSAYDNMNNLNAGETWNFKAESLTWYGVRVVSYKLADISYW